MSASSDSEFDPDAVRKASQSAVDATAAAYTADAVTDVRVGLTGAGRGGLRPWGPLSAEAGQGRMTLNRRPRHEDCPARAAGDVRVLEGTGGSPS